MSDITNTAQEVFPPKKELGPIENSLIIQDDFSQAILTTVNRIEGKTGCVDISYVKAFADGSVQTAYDLHDDPDHYLELFPAGSEEAIHLQNEIRYEAEKRGMQWFITIEL